MPAGKVIAESNILKLSKNKAIQIWFKIVFIQPSKLFGAVKVLNFYLVITFHWLKRVYI